MKKAYAEDLAYIHDIAFTGFVRDAIPGLLKILRLNRITSGLVLDLGCGSGILARKFTRTGYEVLGIDISGAMLNIARKRAPRAQFQKASLFRMKLPPCVAVLAIGECLNYLFDKNARPQQLERFFGRVHRALRPGGVFVFDVAEPGRVERPQQSFMQRKDWALFLHQEEDAPRRHLTRRMVIFRRMGKLYRRSEEVHRLRLYPRSQVIQELRLAGFHADVLDRYCKSKFSSAHVGFLAIR